MKKLYKQANDDLKELIENYCSDNAYLLGECFKKLLGNKILDIYISKFHDDNKLYNNVNEMINEYKEQEKGTLESLKESPVNAFGGIKGVDEYWSYLFLATNVPDEYYLPNYFKKELSKDIAKIIIQSDIFKNLYNSNGGFDELCIKISNIVKKSGAIEYIFSEVIYYGSVGDFWKERVNEITKEILSDSREDNWDYENHVDNEFDKRPNKRINRILKRMYKDARKMK